MINPPNLPVRPELVGERPYGAPQIDAAVLLNVNENPYPPPPQVSEAMAAAVAVGASGLNRYPDREASALRTDLAAYLGHGLGADRVWAANGSNEVMVQILQAFGGPGRRVMSFDPTYSMYPQYARDTSTEYLAVERSADFTLDADAATAAVLSERPSVVLVASPNNPTGTALPLDTVERLCEATREVGAVFVVDEAYAEFRRDGTPSALSLLDDFGHLAVTRTMSKAFAFAGGRLGYVASSGDVIDVLRVVRLPYHLSSLTQTVARVALAHADTLLAQVEALRQERDATAAWLRAEGFDVADSDANFVLFGRFERRHEIWQRLLDRDVLVREVGPEGWLRVSIGTPDEMMVFRQALNEAVRSIDEEADR